MARSSDGRSTLSRQLQVLDAFSVEAPFLTVAEISRRTGLPVSTTHALVRALADVGLLELHEARRYRLGVRLWELAARTPGALGLRELAGPHLHAAHATVGQHVQLGILNGADVLFLERLSARDAVVNATVIGGRLPLTSSSSGLVLLADADPSSRETVLAGPIPAYTERTPRTSAEVRRLLAQVRRQRFAMTEGFIHPDARGIAVAVTGAAGETVAAIGAVVPNDRTPWEPVLAVLRSTATAISADLRAAALPQSHPDASPGGSFRALVHSSDDSMSYLASRRLRARDASDESVQSPRG
ncbi:IclR family transcriptional regulator [Agromyces seonyuensis]|uniref:Helix-turn-helix domain-containing protein n=1 Tax=Agromyces seonyuensis TaxID=2662446 RepID=A0A6I4P291_9MICO|nr:IclR family transcriptional regulator [Agromyces seonyuensis]MWB98875.1 helix-turn-helix domain-containing protein [Agromyces seonyuensis]